MFLAPEVGAEPVHGYRLVRRLGRGGFGEVWEAEAPGGVRVALKFIRLDSVQAKPELRALDLIRNIRHPHLLDLQFAVRDEDYLILAMPLCDQTLTDRLRECKERGWSGLPRGELLGYMDELARAVDFLNEPRHPAGDGGLAGIQHRDIKPHNAFLVGGSVRLADFGLAKILETNFADHSGSMTPHYVAPEVLDGRVSQRSDQYSLAITYCQLRAGRLPFEGSISEIISGHLYRAPDLSGLPVAERAVVARALAKRPEERWPSCREFVQHLTEAASTEAVESLTLVRNAPLGDYSTLSLKDQGTGVAPSEAQTQLQSETNPGLAVGAIKAGPRTRSRLRLFALGGMVIVLVAVAAAFSGINRFAPRGRSRAPAGVRPVVVSQAGKVTPPVKIPDRPAEPNTPPPHVGRPSPEPPPARPVALAETNPDRGAAPDPELAKQGVAALKKYCHRCHGVRFEVKGYDVLDRDILVAKRGEGEKPYVVPGKPEESEMWERVGVEKDMPPSGAKPSDAERDLFKRWIAVGAPFPVADASTRVVKAERDVLATLRDHLGKARLEDRAHLRYFSFANLYNNRGVRDDELRLARAALAKLVNSLSWKPDIAVPQAVDAEQTVFVIDERDLGWDERDLWMEILAQYPYGLKHDKDPAQADRTLAEDVYEKAGTSMPFVRADWFIANASRPPLYHTLLDMPKRAQELERMLKVDVEGDFLQDKLARAGFAKSGISSHNRLVDRHSASHGAYWKSYDFRRSEGTGNLFRFPLGPVFDANPFPNQAFEHAGGEIIFNLPNGMQGYLLVDAKGNRIDAGPTDIVGDDDKTAGTSAVVNGLSCLACHRTGMQPFKDSIRGGLAVAGEARNKVDRLFPTKAAMDKLVARDETRFLTAVDQAAGAFLKAGDDKDKAIRDFPEMIGAVARGYLKDLNADDVAAELAIEDPKTLPALIRSNARLRQLGLGPLFEGGTIKRSEWDSLEGRFLSTFHECARELDLGTPFRAF